MDCLTSRILLQKVCSYKCQFFTKVGPKHWVSPKKIWPFLKGINCVQVVFVLIWMKQGGNENGLPNIRDTFAESWQLQISVLHQIMCIFKAGLSNSYDCWVKYKKKVTDVSDPNQNVETTCKSKLTFT